MDDLRLVLAPSLAGRGKRLFGDGDLQLFDLLSEERTGGCLLLHYRMQPEG